MNAETSFRVARWTAASRTAMLVVALLVVALAIAPLGLGPGAMDRLTILFVYLILAAMWNALAGYAGLVSVGQQLFFGLGAYFTVKFADLGANPFLAMLLAAAAGPVLDAVERDDETLRRIAGVLSDAAPLLERSTEKR